VIGWKISVGIQARVRARAGVLSVHGAAAAVRQARDDECSVRAKGACVYLACRLCVCVCSACVHTCVLLCFTIRRVRRSFVLSSARTSRSMPAFTKQEIAFIAWSFHGPTALVSRNASNGQASNLEASSLVLSFLEVACFVFKS